jgi:hypothetical protein
MTAVAWRLITAAALSGLVAASAWAILTGAADYFARRGTVAGTERALALAPGRADYHLQLALLVSDEDSGRADRELRLATSLNPSDARSWIELGLRAEAGGDTGSGERYLLKAAEINNEYLPKWTLANYYFRRNENDRFWFWSKAAAQMIYGDPLPLFRLCGAITEDGNLIERLEIRNPSVQSAYLSYLLARDRIDLIGPSTRRVLEQGRESDVPILLTACDRLMEAKSVDGALTIWNGLADARKIPGKALHPNAERVLADDNFISDPLSQGFDWRLSAVDGIAASREERPAGLRLNFSGQQSEDCEPLSRFLPVLGNSAYEFTVSYRTAGIQPATGLRWTVTDVNGGDELAEPESLSSEDETMTHVRFVSPANCRLVRIALRYKRALGTTRIEGSISLRGAGLRHAGAGDQTPARPENR